MMLTLFVFTAMGQKKKKSSSISQSISQTDLQYEINGNPLNIEGSYVVDISVIFSDDEMTSMNSEQLKRAAVHGVIFKGYMNSKEKKQINPLVKDSSAEFQNAEFFKSFFAHDGEFNVFAEIIPNTYRRIKLNKKSYKWSATVNVKKDRLRGRLEKAKIIRGLNSAF